MDIQPCNITIECSDCIVQKLDLQSLKLGRYTCNARCIKLYYVKVNLLKTFIRRINSFYVKTAYLVHIWWPHCSMWLSRDSKGRARRESVGGWQNISPAWGRGRDLSPENYQGATLHV